MSNIDENISLDQVKAKTWISEVENEIELVKQLLQKIANEISEDVEEEDPIMQKIMEIGSILEGEWKVMIVQFKKSINLINAAINAIINGFDDLIEYINKIMKQL